MKFRFVIADHAGYFSFELVRARGRGKRPHSIMCSTAYESIGECMARIEEVRRAIDLAEVAKEKPR